MSSSHFHVKCHYNQKEQHKERHQKQNQRIGTKIKNDINRDYFLLMPFMRHLTVASLACCDGNRRLQ